MDQSKGRERPGTAPLKRAIRCTRQGLFIPVNKSAEVATVTAFLNSLATDLHTQKGIGVQELADVSAISAASVSSRIHATYQPLATSQKVSSMSGPESNRPSSASQLFRANRKQTHTAVSTVPLDERIEAGRAQLASEIRHQNREGVVLATAPLPNPPPESTILDLPSNNKSLTSAALRKREADWLVFWGNVTHLGGELSAMIDKLSLSESEASRLRSEVGWLNERLSRCNEDFKELQLAIISEEQRHRNMILIERDKYNALKSDLETMSAMVADMRRRVTHAEAAVASAHADIDEHKATERELKRAMVLMSNDHAIELLAQKEALAAELAMDKRQKSKLGLLEADNKALNARLAEQQKVIDQLTTERATPNSQAAGAAFLKKFENQLDPSTVKTFMKFARTQGDVVERLAILSSSKEEADKSKKKLALLINSRSAALERAMMELHDTNGSTFAFGRSNGGSESYGASQRGSASSGGSAQQRYDASKMPVPIPSAVANDGVAWRQLAPDGSLRAANVLYKELMVQQMPKGAGAMAEAIHCLWQEVTRRVPPDLHMAKNGERERLHQKVVVILAPAQEAWKGALRCHTSATDLLVSEGLAGMEQATKVSQLTMSLANVEEEYRLKQVSNATESSSLSIRARNLEEQGRGYESLIRLAMASINDAIVSAKFQLNAVSPRVQSPPTEVTDMFPAYITAEGAHQLTTTTPLALARTAYLVEDFCSAVRYEHQKATKRASGAGTFTISQNEYQSEIELLKAKCVRAEKEMSESHSLLLQAREDSEAAKRKGPTLADLDISGLRPRTISGGGSPTTREEGTPSGSGRRKSGKGYTAFPRSRSVSEDGAGPLNKVTLKDSATQCTILPLKTSANRLPRPSSAFQDSRSSASSAYKLSPSGAGDTTRSAPLEASMGPGQEGPLTSQSSLFTLVRTEPTANAHSLSLSTSPLNARSPPLMAATNNSLSKYHIVNNTGQEDALYYQLQRMQRNGGVRQSLPTAEQQQPAKGRRAVGRAPSHATNNPAGGWYDAPEGSRSASAITTTSNGFMQIRGMR